MKTISSLALVALLSTAISAYEKDGSKYVIVGLDEIMMRLKNYTGRIVDSEMISMLDMDDIEEGIDAF